MCTEIPGAHTRTVYHTEMVMWKPAHYGDWAHKGKLNIIHNHLCIFSQNSYV
jgi:hypothetical protein